MHKSCAGARIHYTLSTASDMRERIVCALGEGFAPPSRDYPDNLGSPQLAGGTLTASQADDLPSVGRVVGRNTEKQTFAF